MFSVGDRIVYGSMGVCTVLDIGLPDIPGATRECYMLKPHYVANSKVYAPIENNPVRMRPLLSEAEAQALVDSMPDLEPFPRGKDKQELYETCKNAIRSCDSFLLAKLLKTLYENKVRLVGLKKTVPSTEKDYFDTAEKMLHGEIAAALQMPLCEVEGYISARVEPPQAVSAAI